MEILSLQTKLQMISLSWNSIWFNIFSWHLWDVFQLRHKRTKTPGGCNDVNLSPLSGSNLGWLSFIPTRVDDRLLYNRTKGIRQFIRVSWKIQIQQNNICTYVNTICIFFCPSLTFITMTNAKRNNLFCNSAVRNLVHSAAAWSREIYDLARLRSRDSVRKANFTKD